MAGLASPFDNVQQDGFTRLFPVNSQGTFIYTKSGQDKFAVVVTPDAVDLTLTPGKEPTQYIALYVDDTSASFYIKSVATTGYELLASVKNQVENGKDVGTEKDFMCSYWLSYDRDNCILKYGKGYRMVETTLLAYDYKKNYLEYISTATPEEKEIKTKEYETFFSPTQQKYVLVMLDKAVIEKEKLGTEEGKPQLITTERTFQFDPNPLYGNLPPVIMDSDKVTLFDLDRNQYMFSASLPPAAKELYSNVKNLELDYPFNPVAPLSDAIRYSLDTPGKHLYKILEEKRKDGEFSGEDEVYIRITCGPNQPTGPGIPYVLEIWPKGCRSPIHNHSGACAVIKVLYGQIQISIYNKGTNPPTPAQFIKKFDAKAGQFTWMGPNWYQRHELRNTTNDYCATIQCYRYNYDDHIRWPGFDFVEYNEDGEATDYDTFIPNTDGNFQNMRAIVLKEYQEYLMGKTV